jgi:hypothetical protein
MKLKNIKDAPFDFEGTHIEPLGIVDVPEVDVYARLLALYFGHTLIPEDEEVTQPLESIGAVTIEQTEVEEEEEEEEEGKVESIPSETFICNECKKEFPTAKGLNLHSIRVHK